ncbi:MAG TPA: hypothetical protein PKW80_08170 [Bacteroidales bacterium]|nr:hypothetical protein [Bacteroidales bacterium]
MEAIYKGSLLKNEKEINTWDLNYTFVDGTNFFGSLTITNKRILFETKVMGGVQALLATSLLFKKQQFTNHVFITKSNIERIEILKDDSGNKAVLNFKNGEKHLLDRKMLSVDKIVEALIVN